MPVEMELTEHLFEQRQWADNIGAGECFTDRDFGAACALAVSVHRGALRLGLASLLAPLEFPQMGYDAEHRCLLLRWAHEHRGIVLGLRNGDLMLLESYGLPEAVLPEGLPTDPRDPDALVGYVSYLLFGDLRLHRLPAKDESTEDSPF